MTPNKKQDERNQNFRLAMFDSNTILGLNFAFGYKALALNLD